MAKRKTAKQDEQAFLAAYDASMFPHPSVAVDVAIVTVNHGRLHALLIPRGEHPDLGKWSLPGGFVGMAESLDDAASRQLTQKAGLDGIFLEQLYTFGSPDRDPRTRVITVAYYALVNFSRLKGINHGSKIAELSIPWDGEGGGPVRAVDEDGQSLPLAFDHADILGLVVQRLRGKLNYAPIGFELLPKRFTLRDLQTVHEAVLGRSLNKDSFRRRMLATGLVTATGQREKSVGHRPAELYRFNRRVSRS